MAESSKVTIKIPRPLYENIRILIEGSGFSSPTDFIVYVLRDVLGGRAAGTDKAGLTPSEVDAIRQRLKNLGYL